MIKFFRKIRQNLLSEGKTGKYLKYAIGEIVLVVIGILIALQVNKWNNVQIDKSTACKYVENISIDLNTDLENLHDLNIRNKFYEELGFYILNFFEKKLEVIDTNKLKQALVYNSYCPSYNKSSSTYDELIYSGNLKLFEDSDLKRKMDKYYIYDSWRETFDDRIRHTMWYDYQDELLTVFDPLIFRTIYNLPDNAHLTLVNGEIGTISELNDYDVDWEVVRKNLKLQNNLKRILAHRVQIANRFAFDINQTEELIRRLQEISCSTID